MDASPCTLCARHPASIVAEVDALLDAGNGRRVIPARVPGVLEGEVSKHIKHRRALGQETKNRRGEGRLTPDDAAPKPVIEKPKPAEVPRDRPGTYTITGDEGTLDSGFLTQPITDWDALLRHCRLDPEFFEIDEKNAQQSTVWDGLAGEGEVRQLHRYRINFRRKRLASETDKALELSIEMWRKELLRGKSPRTAPAVAGDPCTYVMAIADPQLGKKGTETAVANWKRGVLAHAAKVKRLMREGYNIERVVVAFQGDEHEQVANNYTNQPHTVELNLTQQLELDLDLRIWTVRQALALGLPVLVTSVISNHGEITRNGGKDPVTTKGDNSSTMIARMARRVFEGTPGAELITWNIAESNPDIVVNLSGVLTLFAHGHIAKGKGASTEQRSKSAIERQILGRTQELAQLRIALLAHYHHFYMLEDGGRTFFGCPALEADKSSEYMLDQYGVWSPSGMLGLLIGDGFGVRGWAEPSVY